MPNYRWYYLKIRTGSPETREQIIQEIKGYSWVKLIFNEFSCTKDGECDLFIYAKMIWDTFFGQEFLDFHKKYPEVTEEIRACIDNDGLVWHQKFNSETREELWTKDDCMAAVSFEWAISGRFHPDDINMHTYRKVYDWQNNLLFEESETLPLPIEEMLDDLSADGIRHQYELWKKNPDGWEELRDEIERQLDGPRCTVHRYYQKWPQGECVITDDDYDWDEAYEWKKTLDNNKSHADGDERNDGDEWERSFEVDEQHAEDVQGVEMPELNHDDELPF